MGLIEAIDRIPNQSEIVKDLVELRYELCF